MNIHDFLPYSFQDDLLIFTSSHLKQDLILSKSKYPLIKATPTGASILMCPLRRDIITWYLNLKDLVTNEQGKKAIC